MDSLPVMCFCLFLVACSKKYGSQSAEYLSQKVNPTWCPRFNRPWHSRAFLGQPPKKLNTHTGRFPRHPKSILWLAGLARFAFKRADEVVERFERSRRRSHCSDDPLHHRGLSPRLCHRSGSRIFLRAVCQKQDP